MASVGEAGAAVQSSSRRLRAFLAVQIAIPTVLLGWRLVFGELPFAGWGWGMYT